MKKTELGYLRTLQEIDGDLIEEALTVRRAERKKAGLRGMIGTAAACLAVCAVLVMIPLFRLPKKPDSGLPASSQTEGGTRKTDPADYGDDYPVYRLSEHIYEGESYIEPEPAQKYTDGGYIDYTEKEKEMISAKYEELLTEYPEAAKIPPAMLRQSYSQYGESESCRFTFFLGGIAAGCSYEWSTSPKYPEGNWRKEEDGFRIFYQSGVTESQMRDMKDLLAEQILTQIDAYRLQCTENLSENLAVYWEDNDGMLFLACEHIAYVTEETVKEFDCGGHAHLFAKVHIELGDTDSGEDAADETTETVVTADPGKESDYYYVCDGRKAYAMRGFSFSEEYDERYGGWLCGDGMGISLDLIGMEDPPTLIVYPDSGEITLHREGENEVGYQIEKAYQLWEKEGSGSIGTLDYGGDLYAYLQQNPGTYYLTADFIEYGDRIDGMQEQVCYTWGIRLIAVRPE